MEKQTVITGFQHVDTSQYQILIEFLENVASHPIVKEGLDLQMKYMDLKAGNQVLDVGCGVGIQAQELAKRVGTSGKVVGTDISTIMIEVAKRKVSDSDLPIDFFVAEASSQPFPDQSFDSIRTERVLMYIPEVAKVLQEFKRLLKPGGKLVIFEFNWDGALISHEDKELTRRITHYLTDSFPNNRIGYDLYYELKSNGFKNVNAKPYAYHGSDEIILDIVKKTYIPVLQQGISEGVFTKTEIDNWWESLDEGVETGKFFMSFPGLIAYATKD